MSNNIPSPNTDRISILANLIGREEGFIDKITIYASNLEKRGYPIIFSLKHLSLKSGIDYNNIIKIYEKRNELYRNRFLKKRKGGRRHIRMPNDSLRLVQNWIKENILDKVEVDPCVTSYCKNRSIKNNAEFHINSDLLIKIDLQEFYNHINVKAVYNLFRRLGYNKSISIFLSNFCCIYDESLQTSVLPQGASTSPAISNLVCMTMDARLMEYSNRNNYRYSRYSDDLTFSTDNIQNKISYKFITQIINESGYIINNSKTRFLRKNTRQTVTGLNVNNGVTISKVYRKKIETHLHNCLKFGVTYHMKKAEIDKINFREWLLGNIFYIISIHPEQGKRMKRDFDKINWLI